jgi:hypothetical protein
MSAKDIIEGHAAKFGLGETGQIDLLCNFLDQHPDGTILEQLQAFVDQHGEDEFNAMTDPVGQHGDGTS